MAEMLHRRRFTVDEYRRMGESGILADDERLELVAGHIVVREPIGARHAGTVDRLTRLWTSRLGERAIVRIQNPVRFAKEDSELQPDVMLLRPRDDFYTTSHPAAATCCSSSKLRTRARGWSAGWGFRSMHGPGCGRPGCATS